MLEFNPVTIDLKDVCAELARQKDRDVLDIEAALWLRAQGFVPARDPLGSNWLADEISLRSLEKLLGPPRGEIAAKAPPVSCV